MLAASAAALAADTTTGLSLRTLVIPVSLGVLCLWILASSVWGSPTEAVPESQRALVYVSGALALALALRRGSTIGVLVGVWGGISIVCLYALATRLFPERLAELDPIAGYRLSEPIGYWNVLGLFAALGVILAFGLVARSEQLVVRLVAAGSTVPLVLTLYFTFSRGAWIALAAGLVATLALDPHRARQAVVLAVVAPLPALAVVIASSSGPLSESGHTLTAAAADGRDVAALTVGLMLVAAAVVALLAAFEPRVRLSRRGRRIGNGAVLAGVVVLCAACVMALGGPFGIARSFAAAPEPAYADLDERLFTLTGNGRVLQWRIALDLAGENPLVGSGAGSYERYWLEHRPDPASVRDAHSLYVETLAELGPFGLALIVVVFGFPLVLALRSRHRPSVPIAAGALVAYLAHAGIDWDWEFSLLTLIALACASVIVAEAGVTTGEPVRWLRVAVFAVIAVLVPVAALGTLGSRAEAAATEAFDERDFDRSATAAERAERLEPWSVEPLVLLGRAQAAGRDREAARKTFERVLAREPDHWRAWFELAAVTTGRDRSLALRRARALNPLEPMIGELEESR